MPVPSTSTMWSAFGTLDSYMDFSQMFSLGHTFIQGTVIKGFLYGKLGPAQIIYGADLITLVMSLAAAALVVCKSVDTGVSFGRGLYATYAGGSQLGNLIYLLEAIVIIAW